MNGKTEPEELAILARVVEGESPQRVADELGVPYKRLVRWCEKWEARWDYDWGVGITRGFFYDECKPEVRAWIEARKDECDSTSNP